MDVGCCDDRGQEISERFAPSFEALIFALVLKWMLTLSPCRFTLANQSHDCGWGFVSKKDLTHAQRPVESFGDAKRGGNNKVWGLQLYSLEEDIQ